jgi:hypothetical protein
MKSAAEQEFVWIARSGSFVLSLNHPHIPQFLQNQLTRNKFTCDRASAPTLTHCLQWIQKVLCCSYGPPYPGMISTLSPPRTKVSRLGSRSRISCRCGGKLVLISAAITVRIPRFTSHQIKFHLSNTHTCRKYNYPWA